MRINLIVAASGLVIAGCALPQTPPPTTDRATVMQACEAVFGSPVDQERGLFEVDRDFVLEARFDDRGWLTRLIVEPKHWLSDTHPEWDETEDVCELSESRYESLLRQLDSIQPRGRLVRPDELPVVRGTTMERRDVYEHAVVVTGDVVDDTRPDDAPRAIKYLIVSPITQPGDAGSEVD